MPPRSLADVYGPWIETEWTSGLIDRCREYWNTPIKQVPDCALVTFLNQQLATELVISEARPRVDADQYDGTEWYDGLLVESLALAERRLSEKG